MLRARRERARALVELLRRNPDADLDAIAALCDRYELGDAFRTLRPEVEASR